MKNPCKCTRYRCFDTNLSLPCGVRFWSSQEPPAVLLQQSLHHYYPVTKRVLIFTFHILDIPHKYFGLEMEYTDLHMEQCTNDQRSPSLTN